MICELEDKIFTTEDTGFESVALALFQFQFQHNPVYRQYVELDFTDKEGDISDTIFVKKTRTNRIVVPTIRDSFVLQVPPFPDRSRGIIQLELKYQNHLLSAINPPSSGGTPPNLHDDTLVFQFALRDKAKHISDTVTTGPIIIVR